jgi:hypothetical protein
MDLARYPSHLVHNLGAISGRSRAHDGAHGGGGAHDGAHGGGGAYGGGGGFARSRQLVPRPILIATLIKREIRQIATLIKREIRQIATSVRQPRRIHHMHEGIRGTQVRQELITLAFALVRSRNEARHVNQSTREQPSTIRRST